MARPNPVPRYADTPALSRRQRVVVLVAIVLLHGVVGLALLRALGGARGLEARMGLAPVVQATIFAQPKPPDRAPATRSHRDEGASGVAARRAQADQIIAAPERVPAPAMTAAPVAGTGSDSRSGASAGGEGTGGAASGTGTGSGGAGSGSGGRIVATRPVKIAGELAEGDYAREGRARRLGSAVIVVLTVGIEGRVTACRVQQPSGDPDADAVTCRLATARFRFRPALDQNGEPIVALFGWQQRFFWN